MPRIVLFYLLVHRCQRCCIARAQRNITPVQQRVAVVNIASAPGEILLGLDDGIDVALVWD